MQVEELLNDLTMRAMNNQQQRVSIKCRTFMKKLGYQTRSKKRVEEVEQAIRSSKLTLRLPEEVESWSAISPDDSLHFYIEKQVQMIRKAQHTPPLPYAFQAEAIHRLHQMRKKTSFKGLVVLPTGGGKTTTAVRWLWEAALVRGKKVLWLAHRHELLNQAYATFCQYAQCDITYRIVSGVHDSARLIQDEQLLIASKDSLVHHEAILSSWLADEQEVYVVVDEAHHATSTTYKTLLSHIERQGARMYLLGLTATPFRTAESEQGALRALFTDGIFYKKNLKHLIANGILAAPHFHSLQTDVTVQTVLNEEQWRTLQQLDQLPESIMQQLVANQPRNHMIVQQYVQRQKQYGKTILFAMNRLHALTLAQVFKQYGIDARVVISNHETSVENQQTIQAFRENVFPVLINVAILTEGADFPDVQTVFLTRPTVSAILMTQMVGRALRGVAAGGTKEAYIVSFIDEWAEKIAWSNPRVLLAGENLEPIPSEQLPLQMTQMISAKMVEQVAQRLQDQAPIEERTFEQSVPKGIYSLRYIHEERAISEDILVYESDVEDYEAMFRFLPTYCVQQGLHANLERRALRAYAEELEMQFFIQDQLSPMYDIWDLVTLIHYYLVTGECPKLLAFKERQQINVTDLAKKIMKQNMSYREQQQYVFENWEQHPFLRIFFDDQFLYYKKCIQTELILLEHTQQSLDEEAFRDTPLNQLKRQHHAIWRKIVYRVFEENQKQYGQYTCVKTGYASNEKIDFHIAYKVSLKRGGTTTVDNLTLVHKKYIQEKSSRRT